MEAAGFNSDNTYVFFETFIPEGWSLEDFNEQEAYGGLRDEHAEYNKR